jgi:hypothetical protein
MKLHISIAVIMALCLSLFCSFQVDQAHAQAKKAPAKTVEKITVLNPLGVAPSIKLKPMAPRPSSLDGKTIYLVDNGYLGSDLLLREMVIWFNTNMPKVNAIFKRQAGGFSAEDPKLWAEIKEKADGVIIGMGH